MHFSDCLTATLKQKYLFGQPVPCDVMQSNCYHYLLLGQAMRCILFKKLFFKIGVYLLLIRTNILLHAYIMNKFQSKMIMQVHFDRDFS